MLSRKVDDEEEGEAKDQKEGLEGLRKTAQ